MRVLDMLMIVLVVLIFATCATGIQYGLCAHEKANAQLHNPYYPFSVETVIHDR